MPVVNGKEYAYTPAGIAAAQKAKSKQQPGMPKEKEMAAALRTAGKIRSV